MTTTTRNLTKAQALATYRKICKHLGQTPHPDVVEQGTSWPSGPVLCRDFEGWYSTSRWAIVWEGGPYEWVVPVSFNVRTAVFLEPINGFALGLYPA
jgi:hypothetical protein